VEENMNRKVGMLFITAGFAAAASVAQAQDSGLKPHQTFRFASGAYGCVSKDKLDAVDRHARAGEQQEMQRYFEGYECVPAPEHSDFRVVRVVGHDVEFVNAGNGDTRGLWTNDRFIRP
jgi:hypothetical protein